jgi:DNA adenine methylase
MSLLSYPGSKRKFIHILEKHIPKGSRTIVSPFFGSGSFEFHLANQGYKVVACDIYPELVNFWHNVRCSPNELADEVEKLMPITKNSGTQLLRQLRNGEIKSSILEAASFYVINRVSYNGTTRNTMLRNINTFNNTYHKYTNMIRRFEWPKKLSLTLCDYKELLIKHPKAFVFADPPYMLTHNNLYGIKSGQWHSGFNHKELFMAMERRPKALITYNGHPELKKMYNAKFTEHQLQDRMNSFHDRKYKTSQGHVFFVTR